MICAICNSGKYKTIGAQRIFFMQAHEMLTLFLLIMTRLCYDIPAD